MEPKDRRKVDDFILYGMAAAVQAVRDSGWEPATEEDRCRTGVMIGSGIGGLTSIAETAVLIKEKGPKRVSPFFIPGSLINLISGQVSIRFGFKGPNHAVVTACSTGAHAIGDAARLAALLSGGSPDQNIAMSASACSHDSLNPMPNPARTSRTSAPAAAREVLQPAHQAGSPGTPGPAAPCWSWRTGCGSAATAHRGSVTSSPGRRSAPTATPCSSTSRPVPG